jgi:hypothetical protein
LWGSGRVESEFAGCECDGEGVLCGFVCFVCGNVFSIVADGDFWKRTGCVFRSGRKRELQHDDHSSVRHYFEFSRGIQCGAEWSIFDAPPN